MTSLFRPRQSFLQNNAWQNQALNALHYNTSQQGSVIPIIYGTMRQQVNLIDLGNYRGPKGKKGKSGSLPLAGTSQTGKGAGGGKGKGGKKNSDYTVNVDFGICQGPITLNTSNQVYSSSGVESFSATGLYFYNGSDDQALDSVMNTVNYSGTCHVVGKPIDLGQSPVLPNIAFEITGVLAGVHVGSYTLDANPADVITDFLTNLRYGAAFPSSHLSQLTHDDTGAITNTYGDYCQAAALMISTSLDGHQKAIEWLDGITKLTNSVLVWSGGLLKIVPYGDLSLSANSASWNPNWTHQYELTDDHFLPWHPRQEGSAPTPGEDDPVVVTRTNPADADNWVSIEYLDRNNFYNSTTITSFDQGAIDTYGLRIGDSLPGRAFANQHSAQISLQLILQRRLYIRNTGIRFQLGWQFALLEPMDLVGITGRFGDNYLSQYTVRITSIEENDNGDLTVVGEDPQPGTSAPVAVPPPIAVQWGYYQTILPGALVWNGNGAPTGWDPVYDWRVNHPADSPTGTFSTWINMIPPFAPLKPGDPTRVPIGAPPSGSTVTTGETFGLMRTVNLAVGAQNQLAIVINYDLAMYIYLGGVAPAFVSATNTLKTDGRWQHVMISWNLTSATVKFWLDGAEIENTITPTFAPGAMVRYSLEVALWVNTFQNLTPGLGGEFYGCTNHLWFDGAGNISDPSVFRNLNKTPTDLGLRGEVPLGRPPNVYLHWDSSKTAPDDRRGGVMTPGIGWYGINRAGLNCDNGAYWAGVYPSSANANLWCDPAHPNFDQDGNPPTYCTSTSWR